MQTFDSFVKGAKNGLVLVFDIFPYILAIMLAVEVFRLSGLSSIFVGLVSPVFQVLGIPQEVCELVFLRPFTGSGSIALLIDIFLKYGPDSYISRCASVILASSETVFYVSSIYLSKTSVKKLGIVLPLALLGALISAILSCLLVKIF
ncbi:MAG: nucleoside recognition domain-containing protein [Christensenellales bacterium]